MRQSELLTIGYEGASIEDFVATLEHLEVKIVIDIRELPISRKRGFSKNKLNEWLKAAGIRYLHLKDLGDPRLGREAARRGDMNLFRDIFSDHMNTERAKIALDEAQSIAQSEKSCLLCFERLHKNCHRDIVANSLSDLGFTIRHVGVRADIRQLAN